jgi:AcrR family transcriptional regulator
MGRPRQVTDDQIDEAARATFVRHGASAPVSLVAKALGISQAALFHRAQSKEELLLRALRPRVPAAAAALAALAAGPQAGAIRDQLQSVLAGLLAHLEEVTPCLAVLRSAGLPVGRGPQNEPPTVLLRRRLGEWLARASAAGQASVRHPDVIAEALLGALEARAFNRYLGGSSFTPESDQAFLRRLVEGLVPDGLED